MEETNQRIHDEEKFEKEIKESGANQNRLSPSHIDATIADTKYWQPSGTTMTVCLIVCKNGYCVIGESAAADPFNFNHTIGRRLAYENARRKIWPLEGYLLKETLHRAPSGGASVSRVIHEESPLNRGGYVE